MHRTAGSNAYSISHCRDTAGSYQEVSVMNAEGKLINLSFTETQPGESCQTEAQQRINNKQSCLIQCPMLYIAHVDRRC